MLTTVTKTMTFDCAHRLMHHKGKCFNIHGHTYKIEASFRGEVDPTTGMILDFGDVKDLMNSLVDRFDHAFIVCSEDTPMMRMIESVGTKKVVLPTETTAENMAKYFLAEFDRAHEGVECYRVRLWETPTSHATVKKGV